MNRGSFFERSSSVSTGVASMRPRFMNRGSECRHIDVHHRLQASMRPRFMNRGSADSLFTRSLTGCFNEAPIHESGK